MAASAPAGGPALVDPRGVVPLLAEGWSHAAGGTQLRVVPCSWRATDEDTGPFKRVAWLTGDTIVGLTQFPDLNSTQPFNERRPGLDHLAFGCANRDELKAWEIRLNELGIPNGGIVDTPYYSALSFRDPDNIALEFFAPRG